MFIVSSNLQCPHLGLVVADIPDGVGQLQLQLELPQRGRHQGGGHSQHAGPGPRPAQQLQSADVLVSSLPRTCAARR